MWHNCQLFNAPGSSITNAAAACEKRLREEWTSRALPVELPQGAGSLQLESPRL